MGENRKSVREALASISTQLNEFRSQLMDPTTGILIGVKTNLENHLKHHDAVKESAVGKIIDWGLKIATILLLAFLATKGIKVPGGP